MLVRWTGVVLVCVVAWNAQARPATGMDRPGEDALRHQVGAFVGMGGAARQQRGESRAAEHQRQTNSGAGGRPAPPDLNERPLAPAESALETAWRETLDGWTDHYTRDLVYTELAALRQSLDTAEAASYRRRTGLAARPGRSARCGHHRVLHDPGDVDDVLR